MLLTAHQLEQKPEHQKATKRLQVVEQEIENIVVAIKVGILTPSTKAALERAEAERAKLLQIVQGQHKNVAKVAAFLPNAVGRFKTLLNDLANVTQLEVEKARCLLRVLLGKEIVLHPTADGATRYLMAEVSGDYAGLLRLTVGKNKSGGGQRVYTPCPQSSNHFKHRTINTRNHSLARARTRRS